MTEYVFRPSRKGVRSRLYSGGYRIDGMESVRTIALKTPDKQVAKKRLRDFIVAAQRAAEGLVAPLSERQAAATPLAVLVLEFVADLRALGRDSQYISDTRKRLDRIFLETGWKRLIDIRADVFTAWRATLTGSAKTRKHYQADLMNFLNWLVRLDRLGRNPLAKVTRVSTRGKQVRKARAYTPDELRALFDAAPRRRLAYQVLTYTGQRKAEVAALVWSDLSLGTNRPQAVFRDETMKDGEKRVVPLHPQLAAALHAAKPLHARADAKVFRTFPRHKTLMRDLKRAGIQHKDTTGRVVHFHSFRKTFQTMGARHGIGQRSAQELLGHSDPRLTADVYTDIAGLELHTEIQKLPWITQDFPASADATVIRAVNSDFPRAETRFKTLCFELLNFAQTIDGKELNTLEKWWTPQDSNL